MIKLQRVDTASPQTGRGKLSGTKGKDGNFTPSHFFFFFYSSVKKMICFPSEKETAHWDSQCTRWGISGICFIFFYDLIEKRNQLINTRK